MHSLTQTVHPHVPLFVTVQVRAHIENERENKKCFGKSLGSANCPLTPPSSASNPNTKKMMLPAQVFRGY